MEQLENAVTSSVLNHIFANVKKPAKRQCQAIDHPPMEVGFFNCSNKAIANGYCRDHQNRKDDWKGVPQQGEWYFQGEHQPYFRFKGDTAVVMKRTWDAKPEPCSIKKEDFISKYRN